MINTGVPIKTPDPEFIMKDLPVILKKKPQTETIVEDKKEEDNLP